LTLVEPMFVIVTWEGKKILKISTFLKKKKISVENCQGSSKVYTIKSQYTHHLSLLQMMSPPTPKRKKKFWVWPLVCVKKIKHTHTHNIHTQVVEKKSAFLHKIHLMGRSGQNGL